MATKADEQFVTVSLDRDSHIANVVIRREPVNSMNTAVWTQLLAALDSLEKDSNCRAAIFRSGLSRAVFTAGNDIKELYAPATSKSQYKHFWKISNTFLARLSCSPLVTVAAIKGACPAGGTCLALACDIRIITADGSMGLNEVAIGISVPQKWIKLMTSVVGQGRADKLTMFARMVKAKQALAIGMVDEITADETELLEHAETAAGMALMLPDAGRGMTKMALRGDLAKEWMDEQWLEQEAEGAWKMLSDEKTIAALGSVLNRLSKSKM
ncbi:ClpP/crotonase-like domain-containing protein [Phlyctochytrium arcticum]|nr:ClpP/crotonase-like domain-containing protein [Phlyctochytrium arcticum]